MNVAREQISGQSFPVGVLALTWDDGPDVHTVELARYLRSQHVAATFFVVQRWVPDVSADPGFGRATFHTGYADIPILGELVQLGHRVGNHTLNHALLTRTSPDKVVRQIVENQLAIDPFVGDGFHLFRVPGGAFDSTVATALREDRAAQQLLGPVRWDIDEKDWQDSVECRSTQPATECELWGEQRRLRLKPSVAAHRYLRSIERARRGIVLLHDRVGSVGSDYALELAQTLIPALNTRHYVFTAPILAFSPLEQRPAVLPLYAADFASLPSSGQTGTSDPSDYRFADVNGDGQPDRCAERSADIVCSMGQSGGRFSAPRRWATSYCGSAVPASSALQVGARHLSFQLADVTGDGRADCCAHTTIGITCAASNGRIFEAIERWSSGADFSDTDRRAWFMNSAYYDTVQYADLNGDRRADVCGRYAQGVACALSTGEALTNATTWLSEGMTDADGWLERNPAALGLADVNGDGRTDWCGDTGEGVVCGLAP